MIKYKFSETFCKKFNDYLNSEVFKSIENFSKSSYWQDQASKIIVECSKNNIFIQGESGNYIPNQKGIMRLKFLFSKLLKNPSLLITKFLRKFRQEGSNIKLLNHFDAFNKVMSHDPISDPNLSPFRINFSEITKKDKSFSNHQEISNKYFAKHKYSVTPMVLYNYYYLNILMTKLHISKLNTVLEIGSGNGNFIALIHHMSSQTTIIDVDLPETLCLSIPYIADLFPKAKILFPHEAEGKFFNDYDFVFLTPNQIDLINDQSIDLSLNIRSFQEMTHIQIDNYFKLIQRVGKNNSLFFTSNRVEKIPCGPNSYNQVQKDPPNRFSEYPWDKNNEILIYELCRFMRLVSLESHYIRMERLKK